VQALLEMTRINNLFEIHTEEYVALEAFRGPSARSLPSGQSVIMPGIDS
jgi:hypothetical protein